MNINSLILFIVISFTGEVVGVSDGDTIKVLHNGYPEKIRLARIDCPEHNQAFGQRAKQFTSDCCFTKTVTVLDSDHDRYGRTIGEIILPALPGEPYRRSLNVELVRAGLAWWYRKYAPNAPDLQELENQARDNRLGLWSEPNPMPPWDFRKMEKHNRR